MRFIQPSCSKGDCDEVPINGAGARSVRGSFSDLDIFSVEDDCCGGAMDGTTAGCAVCDLWALGRRSDGVPVMSNADEGAPGS